MRMRTDAVCAPAHQPPPRDAGAAVALSIALMFAAVAFMALHGDTGSTMYDLLGSLSVLAFSPLMR